MRFPVPIDLGFLRHPRALWIGAAAVAAIAPALMIGSGSGKAEKPADAATAAVLASRDKGSAAPEASASVTTPKADGAAATTGSARLPAPEKTASLALLRSVLVSVQQANDTGNYTVLRDLGSPDFQTANTAARLSDIFSGLRARGLDLASVTTAEPEFTTAPEIQPDGMMHVAGTLPSAPAPIAFDLTFASVGQRWMPFSISVGLQPASATAPADKRVDPAGPRTTSSVNTVSKQRALAQPLEPTRLQ